MALTGGKVSTPRGVLSWVPVAFVVKAFAFATRIGTDAYRCLGVIGNLSHLRSGNPGDHTPYSTHDTTVNGRHYVPKKGFVYAIDLNVPDPAKFESWFLGRLRGGFYPWVKYWNIRHHHWNRRIVVGGKPFARSSYSGDDHLHVSGMPGDEYTVADFLADYETYRTTGANVPAKAPTESAPSSKLVASAARKLPAVKKGSKGQAVGIAQAALLAARYWPWPQAHDVVDMDFGPATDGKVRAFQKVSKLPVTGVVDTSTWDALIPDNPRTITRGVEGTFAALMQALLIARGFSPGAVDGHFDDKSVAALQRFQVARKVKNSVVRGKGDGIGGAATWVALLTV